MSAETISKLVILDVLKRTPPEARDAAPAVWATVEHFLPELNDEQAALVVSLILDICPNCLAASRTCGCWQDD
ncbi:MAG TPA: hypothetical protein VFV87_01455 [Pirellulaceae bacterium]|nr:hypothetical protein [Pirellulaceae bacterium]